MMRSMSVRGSTATFAPRIGEGRGGLRVVNADDLRRDAADLGGRVELSIALATLSGEVPHQVFVGVAKDVVALGAVLREVERRTLKRSQRDL